MIVSSRSGLPRMWFSARAVKVNGNSSPAAASAAAATRSTASSGSYIRPSGSKSSIDPPTAPAPAARTIAWAASSGDGP